MRPTPKTLGLLALFLLFVGLNFIDVGTGRRLSEQLPAITAVDRDAVTRVELTTALHKIVLEGISEESNGKPVTVWHLVAPIEGDADQIAVRTLLNQFRKDIPLDAKVDEGNPEDYGLDAGNSLVVELFTTGEEPSVSFVVGAPGPGGSNFVRLSGDDAVYRARIGGRHRYDKPPVDWRNKVLMGFQESDADRVRVVLGEADTPRVEFVRAPPPPGEESETGEWDLNPDPGFSVDQELLVGMIKSAGTLRAGEVLGSDFDGGFNPPLATIEVRLIDGEKRILEVGRREAERAFYVRRAGETEVFRAAAPTIRRFFGRPIDYRDRTMLSFGRDDIDILSWQSGADRVTLQQDLATNLWNVLEPQNIDIDVKFIFFAANTLGTLRADGIAEVTRAEAGLDDPSHTISIRLLAGQERILTLGGTMRLDESGMKAWYAAVDGRSEVFLLSEEQVTKILRAFGRL